MENKEPASLLQKFPQAEIWGVRFAAILTVVMGAVNLLSAVLPSLQRRITFLEDLPLEVHFGGRVTSALAGFGLFVLADGLRRRKRTSWFLTIILSGVSVLAAFLKGFFVEEFGLGLALMGLLLLLRKSFHAHTDRPSLRQGLIILAGTLLFTLIYGTAGFFLLDRHFHERFNLLTALRQTIVMFVAFYNPGLEPLTGFGRYFADSIYVVGGVTLGYALLMMVRPVLVREPATAADRRRAADIVERFGRTSLARAALFPDKSYFFSSGGSVIAFGERGRGALVLGDPIGPDGDASGAIAAFRDFCAGNDWIPAFASVSPDFLDAYHASGFDTIGIGNEAIVDLRSFSLEGPARKTVRYQFNRLTRMGYRAEVLPPPLADPLVRTLRGISNSWLTAQHGGEMHFSVGWFDDEYIRSGAVIVSRSPKGEATAFANLVTEYRKNELTIDLMRRYPNAENGTMEFLFASMLLWAKERGYDSFSLGLSAIVGVGEKPGDPRVEKALHTIAELVGRFYNFKGLHAFKEKFQPRWEPRYLAYPGAAELPTVLTTLLRVHSGDDFLWRYLFS